MSQRYERVNAHDEDDHVASNTAVPESPPPSFRSRDSSPSSHHSFLQGEDPLSHEAEQNLADAFDDGEPSDEEDEADDRQRLMRGQPESSRQNDDNEAAAQSASTSANRTPIRTRVQRTMTELPVFTAPGTRTIRSTNDGVFANMAAKPERGEKNDDKPPTYEQAAADATPPYWETTILAPGMGTDEVYVDGLPVGSVFSFIWNAMISMSFQLVGFLLTYLLHTTHAAKNGSRAGLGLTLVQYGFYMKGNSPMDGGMGDGDSGSVGTPSDPNSHDFNPDSVADGAAAAAAAAGSSGSSDGLSSIASSEWLSYILMIVGWFILIRAVSDFLRARKHEQLVLQSPERGLNVPIIAEGETTERVV